MAPAISAGLLPLVIGVKSWWYPPGGLLGTTRLAVLSTAWGRFSATQHPMVAITEDVVEDVIELTPTGYFWLLALISFVAVAVLIVDITGLRFVLFPPLIVIGFEMFGHTDICSWARRPLVLPVACFFTAAGGLLFWKMMAAGASVSG